jgi:hypothetical protein
MVKNMTEEEWMSRLREIQNNKKEFIPDPKLVKKLILELTKTTSVLKKHLLIAFEILGISFTEYENISQAQSKIEDKLNSI